MSAETNGFSVFELWGLDPSLNYDPALSSSSDNAPFTSVAEHGSALEEDRIYNLKEQLEHLRAARGQKQRLLSMLDAKYSPSKWYMQPLHGCVASSGHDNTAKEDYFQTSCVPLRTCSEHRPSADVACFVQEHCWSFHSAGMYLRIANHSVESRPRILSVEPFLPELGADSAVNGKKLLLLALLADFQADSAASLPSLFFQLRRALGASTLLL